jgi:hypothetical protein
MRFMLKSIFWLGLVYHAMPWGDARFGDALPDPAPALASLAANGGDEATRLIARAALRGTLDLDAPLAKDAGPAGPQPASLDTLTPEDRRAPWRGLGLRTGI